MHRFLLVLGFAALLAAPFLHAQTAKAAAAEACNARPTSNLVVSVKEKGAKGDDRTDDSKAIQKAIDQVAGTGGTVLVPNGTYMVHATGIHALKLKSKMTLKLAPKAVLKVIPNGAKSYAALTIKDASDVNVVGGTILGDRRSHKGTQGARGMGIEIGPKARRIAIVGVTATEMWGDGFYLRDSVDVAFCGVKAVGNRRQGLSIISGSRILVTRSEFRDTQGTAPGAGIDIEPNKDHESVREIDIEHSKFTNNVGGGVSINGWKGKIVKVRINRNVFEGPDPIRIKRAPNIRSTEICYNRFINKQVQDSGGLNKYAEPVESVFLQTDCSDGLDMRFGKNRKK
ncbi:Iota-carrageenase precursor [Methyloligella halotolerans]|uniref:Iota-carrageenase n=1 Tax=Methyloligella halotolerans TaxID=1177755 RepID=A0A1E2S1I3_9HYPH|nr:right-handed parallel beta-helix repeat-containing protein [Methyloligella halotolerans]ODA68185.1 Iota-carrageenase precursor [Methyloligella halotolerans]